LTDRGTEYCGVPDRHPSEPSVGIEDIEHSRTTTKSPQTNGICERFNKTLLNEFYRVAFRKRLYQPGGAADRPRSLYRGVQRRAASSRRWCYGKTPLQTVLDSLALAKEKQIAERASTPASTSQVGAERAGMLTVR
jgi:transposase InsO family protein